MLLVLLKMEVNIELNLKCCQQNKVQGYAQAKVKYNGRTFNQGLKLIEYAHIRCRPFSDESGKVVRVS